MTGEQLQIIGCSDTLMAIPSPIGQRYIKMIQQFFECLDSNSLTCSSIFSRVEPIREHWGEHSAAQHPIGLNFICMNLIVPPMHWKGNMVMPLGVKHQQSTLAPVNAPVFIQEHEIEEHSTGLGFLTEGSDYVDSMPTV